MDGLEWKILSTMDDLGVPLFHSIHDNNNDIHNDTNNSNDDNNKNTSNIA